MVISIEYILGPGNSTSRNVSYILTLMQKQNIVNTLNINQDIPNMHKH